MQSLGQLPCGQSAYAKPAPRLRPFPPAPKSVRVVTVLDETRQQSHVNTRPLQESLGEEITETRRVRVVALGLLALGLLVLGVVMASRGMTYLAQ